ncbi:hypothetical protein GOP47_0011907, partial [Adiantum capillus-veneris]
MPLQSLATPNSRHRQNPFFLDAHKRLYFALPQANVPSLQPSATDHHPPGCPQPLAFLVATCGSSDLVPTAALATLHAWRRPPPSSRLGGPRMVAPSAAARLHQLVLACKQAALPCSSAPG